MRYALISDIHGNLEAFEAALDAISKDKVDGYLSIGDCIGYGADPKECIKRLKSLDCEALIAGNHERGVLGLFDIDNFNEYAKNAVIWTKGVLNKSETDYLETFRLVYEDAHFTLVHGSLESPKEFNYITNTGDAYITSRIMKTPLCFVGHTHKAGIFCFQGDKSEYIRPSGVKIENGKKYLINVGSVGQPRDGDPRAAYVIYDDESGTVDIKRVVYDIEGAQKKILKAGLPAFFAERLPEGR